MKKILLLIVSILFGLLFINSGLNKFFNYMPVPEEMPENLMKIMNAYTQIGWIFPLIAIAEILGGLLFIIPRTRALGAIIIFPVMMGILLTHIVNIPDGLIFSIVLMLVNLWVIMENWQKYVPMIRK